MDDQLTLTLKSQIQVPQLGLGTWQLTGDEAIEAVEYALSLGYRHIDTADMYGNHADIAQAIKQSVVDRSEVFLTTKLWHEQLHAEEVRQAAGRFLDELQTDYIDMLLIHWPNSQVDIKETLDAMTQLKKENIVRSIGVSNFTIQDLQEAVDVCDHIDVNQVEFHPSLHQRELKEFCDDQNIIVTAYSPLGRGEDMDMSLLKELAEKYDSTPAQIAIAWMLHKNMIVIPKAGSTEHIEENFQALKVQLSSEDFQRLESETSSDNRLISPDWAHF